MGSLRKLAIVTIGVSFAHRVREVEHRALTLRSPNSAVRMSGAPDRGAGAQGTAFWAPWVGPHTLGHVERAVTDGFVLSLGVEAGYVLSPVGGLVGDRREVAVDGAWIGVDVGIGMLL